MQQRKQIDGQASSAILEILARPFPFKGRDGRKRTFGEQAPDALAALLAKGYLWRSTGDLIAKVLEAYEADPGLVTLPFGKHEGSRLEQVSDGSVRWLAEEFGWEDPGTILARAVAEELVRRKLPRVHRARWEPEVAETRVPEDLGLLSLWGVPLGAALRNEEAGWWTVTEDLKGLPKRLFKPLNRRGLKALKRRTERLEYLRPDEEHDRPPVLDRDDVLEDRGEFSFESETGGGAKFRKPSAYYVRSGEEKALTDEAERQADGRPTKGVERDRRERKRVYWAIKEEVLEDGTRVTTPLLKGSRDEDDSREKKRVRLWDEALEAIGEVETAPDEKELEWRARVADQKCFVVASLEGHLDEDQELPEHWLEEELRRTYEERKRDLAMAAELAQRGRVKRKGHRSKPKLATCPPDLEYARFVEAGRRLRGVDSHAAYDDAMAWLEGQAWQAEYAGPIGQLCEAAFRDIDRRVQIVG